MVSPMFENGVVIGGHTYPKFGETKWLCDYELRLSGFPSGLPISTKCLSLAG